MQHATKRFPRFSSTVDGVDAPEAFGRRGYCAPHDAFTSTDFGGRESCDECDADSREAIAAAFAVEVGCAAHVVAVTLESGFYSADAILRDYYAVNLHVDEEHGERIYTVRAGDAMGQGGTFVLAKMDFDIEQQRADEAAMRRSERAARAVAARRAFYVVEG